ncbi:MOSC N-terminal beta barrel domain-containing protein [Neiella marina]|uniref:MOSC N-terminal beta barrel domain-containing protein n=1 Tax=Neiella holothuriorum TaxID=2870530 RepID=A0ABS7EJ19_9GAMM|nr:MOSC N-terminal beta barrel domain-containing protein [Neiella holothuriorum]MBW8192348.1 MOSC N-terminal beta barrel domain-containing protein [Neiella holothuriorum]
MAVVSALYIYPVKSLAGFSVASATLGTTGLRWRDKVADRQWVLVNADGRFITQRQLPQLAQIQTELTDQALHLHHAEHGSIAICYDYDVSRPQQVTVWRDNVKGYDEGDLVSQWLADATGKEGLRLVRFGDDSVRPVSTKHLWSGEQSQVAFADGYPILVSNTASLDQFNRFLRTKELTPLSMNRFRANVVVTDWPAWQENQTSELSEQANRYQFALRKPCERCPMITTDQQTGARPEQGLPLKALIEFDSLGNGSGAYFGQNAIISRGIGELIEVGDGLRADS